MASPSHMSAQPAAREKPRSPNAVLEETEKQWIFTEKELARTPSILDGMDPTKERELRGKGINFILQAGIMLKLPQLTLSTAAVFFHRFLMRNSLVEKKNGQKALHHYQVAAISLFLATKVEENCRKMKELVIACCRVAQKNPNLVVDEQTKDFWRWRDTILLNEDVLLEAICFDLVVEAPHKIVFEMLKYYNVDHNKRLRNAAWGFLNDSNLTQACLLFPSRAIAAAALYCAAKHLGVGLPDDADGRPWWEVQHVRLADIQRACNHMATIYEGAPPKEGAESIYVGLRTTPEDEGDPFRAHTRLRPSSQGSPRRRSPSLGPAFLMERGGSDQGVKRSREGSVLSRRSDTNGGGAGASESQRNPTAIEEAVKVAHEQKASEEALRPVDGEPDSKKPKFDSSSASQPPVNTTENGTAREEDGGSEEGEVEE